MENCFIVIVLDSIIAFELHHSDANITQFSSHNRSWMHLSTCHTFSNPYKYSWFWGRRGGDELISMTCPPVSRGQAETSVSVMRIWRGDWKSEDPFSVPIISKDHNPFLYFASTYISFVLYTLFIRDFSSVQYIMTSAIRWVQTWTWHN